jgi:hypothetical protein
VKPPTQLTQQDVLQVAWLSSDANGTSKTLLLTIATQSWHPLGTRFAEEQQSFAEIGVVDFTEPKPTVDIIKRWNGNLHWLPGLVAWYRKEDYARIERYVEGNPIAGTFGHIACNIDTHDPVLSLKAGEADSPIPAIAGLLTTAPIRSRSIRRPDEPQVRYVPSLAKDGVSAVVTDISFPYLSDIGYSSPVLSQCAAWWVPSRQLNRSSF